MKASIHIRTKLWYRKRLPVNEFMLNIATIFVIMYALLEHMSISIPLYSSLKLPMLYIAGICLLPQLSLVINAFMKRKNISVLSMVIVICFISLLSMKMNPQNTRVIQTTSRFVLYLIELFVLVVTYNEKKNMGLLIRYIFGLLLILIVLTDLLFLTSWVTFKDGKFASYLIGTKFNVAYAHMGLLTLWIMKDLRLRQEERATKMKIVLGSILSVVVSATVDCMTGLLGACLFFVLLMQVTRNKYGTGGLLISPAMITACMIGSVVFVFIIDGIVHFPVVTQFITQVMGRSMTLTGRLIIYEQFINGMEGHWLWGYGIGNGFKAASSVFGFDNVQNALMEWTFEAGFLSAVLLVMMIAMIFKRVEATSFEQKEMVMPLILLIYIYVIMGTIEVTFDMSFLMWIAVLFAMANTRMDTASNDFFSGEK